MVCPIMKINLKSLAPFASKIIPGDTPEAYDIELRRKIIMVNVIISLGVLNLVPLGIIAYPAAGGTS